MLPCDRDFGDIERCLRKMQTIYTPSEYAVAIRKAQKINPFTLHEMHNVDFVSMDPVLQCITLQTTTSKGCKVQFRNIIIYYYSIIACHVGKSFA